jgi:type III pantothenate kinase
MNPRILLIDAGNTNTDFAIATPHRIQHVVTVPTTRLSGIPASLGAFNACVLSSVVPNATRKLRRWIPVEPIIVNADADLSIGIAYPNKKQIGADRLANAVALVRLYGAPAIGVDFGTALTFDVVNPRGEFAGGIIAPGLAAMTDYLHEHTALLPRIKPHEPRAVIGKSTVGAMQVGTVIGYRGLVKEILAALRRQPGMARAAVVATGGYAALIARHVPEIRRVNPMLTLEGLRFIYLHNESH